MARAIILMADSLGVGAAPDAEKFGDVGANTLAHLLQAYKEEKGSALSIPNLTKLGLVDACEAAGGKTCEVAERIKPVAAWGYAKELSSGKDTPSGHWEMAGVPVLFDWGYFPNTQPCFPQEFIDELCKRADIPGILGNCYGSGTVILEQLGEEHVKTGMPICYTSVDSVFQIAAHEQSFGLEKLYQVCEIARALLDEMNIGRVIARPFIGTSSADFIRTGNRRDYSVLPPAPTVLDKLANSGGEVISIGKIADIYAHQGITQKHKAPGLLNLLNKTSEVIDSAPDNSLIFTNLVDFDEKFGHRRNAVGYAEALAEFDAYLPTILGKLKDDDVLIITADHGCDPTAPGTDHTREYVPVLAYRNGMNNTPLGERNSFADIGQTLAQWFNLEELEYGDGFADKLVTA
ncbi:phosphopentomutase [Pseudoalteromonas luteoviolacea]|uniref:Phosphopentomutase n=1 Tax=Pseudoalteromonas luteoviolacea S4054 TaxID=1129367 RepID=A0A0F6AHW6_9GAMM|nr:phosphopentomutase [Pseudoalteromonas luteoviolacea]AOT11044.1 phosphopentomutase [Pseudoalteromonas luteoviolacea]AOT15792.1 phosphopentomutase [Pseudoalteromonas luteoviolacea]AOT20865.1 phosphopentomutase [Pseudoalteromonas luteoviolacea]KKE85758.1 phosphopentomutase [Pseudoalteromonas luteoviolacea S4054]KZN71117.1 phosphopentomutase [Pseudoalteromonas luteoviolacea S4047-1]